MTSGRRDGVRSTSDVAPTGAGGRAVDRRRLLLRALGACSVAALLVAGMILPVVGGVGWVLGQATRSVDTRAGSFAPGAGGARAPAASVLTDVTGRPIATLYERYREPVAGADIAVPMKAAIVAIEDRRFFAHDGVDWRGLGRALIENAASGAPLEGQGASTITMQYVKNHRLYVRADTDAERDAATVDTLGRKLTEVRLAHRLESRLSKDEILTRYLNLVYFGHGAYGVQAAARTYFDTTADRLTVSQAALLAGLVRSPALYDPVEQPTQARQRRDTVIAAMVEVGSLTAAQGAAAAALPLGVVPSPAAPAEGCAGARDGTGFFCDHVVDRLAAAGIGPDELRTGGYTVRTTLDPRVADRAEQAVTAAVPPQSDVAHVAAVVGAGPDGRRPVLALAANRDFGPDPDRGQSTLPLVTAPVRGAGSIYKIFTAAAALERGLVTPDTVIPVPDTYTTDRGYTVSNLGDPADAMTLRRALATSPNTAFVALQDRLGSVDPVVDTARRLGLRRSLAAPTGTGSTVGQAVRAQERESFTLGPEPTSPLELASVGATVTAGGTWCPPTAIVSVTDRAGRSVPLPRPPCEQALGPDVAGRLASALGQDHTIGTAADAADAAGWDRPMIGKTGTTQQSRSAAFLGATDRYSAAVMTFAPDGSPVCADPVRTCPDGTLTGGAAPAETWFATMAPLPA